jgi:hypothetical protein
VAHKGKGTDTAPALTRVVVVTLDEYCLAVEALRSMMIDFEFVIAETPTTYAETLHRYWQMGDSFINVEHDIVPYPGALESLDECPYYFCGYDYPIGRGGIIGPCRGSALGCIKFGADLIRQYPDLSEQWKNVSWNFLDGQIFTSLKGKLKDAPDVATRWTKFCWHEHKPPVAHITTMKHLTGPDRSATLRQ